MDQHDPLPGVAAHGLLNALTSMQGLLAAARALVGEGAEREEVAELISAAEARAGEMAEQLQLLARGVPIVIDLERIPDEVSAPSANQDDEPSERQGDD